MKKILPLAIASVFALVVWADDFKILQMNTETVKIGHRECKKGDVFSGDSIIFWSKEKQAIKAQNLATKEIHLFAEPAFRAQKSKTIKDFYLKTNHMSSRMWGLEGLSEHLNSTFYLLDSIKIESPIPLDSTRTYYVRFEECDSLMKKELPSDRDCFYVVRRLFDGCKVADEKTVSIFFSTPSVDEDYLLTDSMRIVILPEE